jgi:hypothetical protein
VRAHPAPALGHVEEQAVVLAALHLHAVARAVLGHHVRLGHGAGHQVGDGAAHRPVGLSALEHPVQRLAGRDLFLPCGQRGADGLCFFVGGFAELGQHPHRRVPVQRPVFAAGKAAAAAVEQSLGVGAGRGLGNGVEQGLHGQIQWNRSSPMGGRPWRARALLQA